MLCAATDHRVEHWAEVPALAGQVVRIAQRTDPPWPIIAALFVPLTVFAALYHGVAAFRELVLGLDLRLLVLLHTWRTVDLGFLMLAAAGVLPMLFAIPAGTGDTIAAWSATFLAAALYAHKRGVAKRWVWWWNLFGLLDFIVAVAASAQRRYRTSCRNRAQRCPGHLSLDTDPGLCRAFLCDHAHHHLPSAAPSLAWSYNGTLWRGRAAALRHPGWDKFGLVVSFLAVQMARATTPRHSASRPTAPRLATDLPPAAARWRYCRVIG